MLPGDRLVCVFVEPQAVGQTFQEWLLHVTIVPWFRLDDASSQIATGLEEALTKIEPFEFQTDERAMFGPHKNRAAMLIKTPTALTDIEIQVRTYLHKKRAWLVDETTKRHYDFQPHITFQGEIIVESGNTLTCDRLYIVEQKGDYKEIMSEIHLGK